MPSGRRFWLGVVVASALCGVLGGVAGTLLVLHWPHRNRTYDTVVQLAADLGCSPTIVGDGDVARERGTCDGGKLTLSTYRDHNDAMVDVSKLHHLYGGRRLVGHNWVVGCDQPRDCETFRDELGGEIVDEP
ncbi:hypothetical protein [Cryptosporangium sp. NPDC051539]|uniref:hypothetical protein n=1 Tax=Cryptosporangium sp. NPDC051539 TaxID=3363962 RepID=UPI00379901EF